MEGLLMILHAILISLARRGVGRHGLLWPIRPDRGRHGRMRGARRGAAYLKS
jgi:hypothetical protein